MRRRLVRQNSHRDEHVELLESFERNTAVGRVFPEHDQAGMFPGFDVLHNRWQPTGREAEQLRARGVPRTFCRVLRPSQDSARDRDACW